MVCSADIMVIYAYVTDDGLAALSKFTLAILDISSISDDYFYGVKVPGQPEKPGGPPEKPGGRRREPFKIPYPAPPVAAPVF